MLKFRELNADEIEVRVAQVGNGWAQLLLYKNARVDMAILDETVGPENWQREHYECKGNLFCRVGIAQELIQNDGTITKEWIWKSDCGAESNTEKEKGEASDSFKRACTNWGIGRELYTTPTIFIKTETTESGGRYKIKNSKERYTVKEIQYDNNKITGLVIANQDDVVLFKKLPEICEEKVIEELPATNDIKKYMRVKRGE